MIPTLSIRAGKGKQQPPAKPAAKTPAAKTPAPIGTTTMTTKPVEKSEKVIPKLVQQQKPVMRTKPPVFDTQCHLLSCLSNFSHRLATRAHDLSSISDIEGLKHGIAGVSDAAIGDGNIKTKTNFSFSKQRSRQSFLLSQKLGQRVIRGALFRSNEKKKKARKHQKNPSNKKPEEKAKSKKTAPSNQEAQKTVVASTLLMTISGASKRARLVKHNKAKRQMKEVDRRHLKKYFCLSCGRPKILGCGFQKVYCKKKTIAVDKTSNEKKKLVRVGIQCIKCSLFKKKQGAKKNPTLVMQSKKVPRSILVKRLQRRNKRGVSGTNHLRVRGNKNVGVKSFSLKMEHTLKFWKTPGAKIQLRRVKDRQRKSLKKK